MVRVCRLWVVDEVQDFTQAELRLLLLLSQLGGTGGAGGAGAALPAVMMTGDSAQCISRGVGFRFADLGAMLYRHVNEGMGSQSSVQVPLETRLSRNYRSHAGILGVANLVSGLLGLLFPQAVDHGEQEQAPFLGPKPIILPDTRWVEVLRLLGGSNYQVLQHHHHHHHHCTTTTTTIAPPPPPPPPP